VGGRLGDDELSILSQLLRSEILLRGYRQRKRLSILSQLLLETHRGFAASSRRQQCVSFNSFPVAAELKAGINVSELDQLRRFQFFPSCCEDLLPRRVELEVEAFNSFPVAAQPFRNGDQRNVAGS
jgi:hypothetical protein